MDQRRSLYRSAQAQRSARETSGNTCESAPDAVAVGAVGAADLVAVPVLSTSTLAVVVGHLRSKPILMDIVTGMSVLTDTVFEPDMHIE